MNLLGLQIYFMVNTPNAFLTGAKMQTDGYRNNSFNNSWSTFYGGKLSVKKQDFKIYGFIGHQKNGMAWLGESIENIKQNGWYTTDMGHFDPSHPMGDLIWRLGLRANWIGTNINYDLPIKNILYFNFGTNAYTYSREHLGSYNKLNELESRYYNYVNTGTRNEV
jgi:iron complex outermembrane receptor protein